MIENEDPMSVYSQSRDQHFSAPGPKRVLCLDGGGVRGALSLGVLVRLETMLRERHGNDPEFRLSDYFDCIAGTSTGAIIAASLALGKSAVEVQDLYTNLSANIFERSLLRDGVLRAKYSAAALTATLQQEFGRETTLGSDRLRTGLLVVMKRADTGSPWPVSNNPKARYYDPPARIPAPNEPPRPRMIPNKDYPLWGVVRASTAAPSYFDPERLVIAEGDGLTVSGNFIDGGVSTANNPSFLTLRFATLAGYKVEWQVGVDNLFIVSVGTGLRPPGIAASRLAAHGAVNALLGVLEDCNVEVETVMQWLGKTDTGRVLDRDIQALEGDKLGMTKLFTYQRYNVELSKSALNQGLALGLDSALIEALQEMDAPENIPLLRRIGDALGKRIDPEHFPAAFDVARAHGQ